MKTRINSQTQSGSRLVVMRGRSKRWCVSLLSVWLIALAVYSPVQAQTTLTPVADTDTQSDVAAGTNATLNASQWNHLMLRFDLASISGSVTAATLRIYQTANSGAYTLNVNTTNTDSWSEGGTKPSIGSLITSSAGRTTPGYVDINVTAYVQSKMAGNKIVSVGLTTNLGTWTPFFSRQNSTNKPQLVITTTGVLDVSAVTSAITVDGNLSEPDWSATSATSIAKVVTGTPNNSASFKARWSSTHLFVAVSVNDAVLQNDSPSEPWNDDAIEIFIDGNNDKSTSYGSDDRQVVRVHTGSSVWTSSTIANLLHGVATTASGYNVEIGIPWSSLGVTASTNKSVGLDVANDDDDNGGARESQIVWNGDGNNWSSTAAFGTIRLVGAPPSVEVSPSSLNFASSAGSMNVSVTANVAWTVSDNQSWISVTPSNGSGNGTVSVSATANTGAARNGTVTISGSGITRTVSVAQAAASTPGVLDVSAVTGTISVDGNLSEADWSGTSPTSIAKVLVGTPNNSASFKARWSLTHLYLAISVNDATLQNDSQSEPWNDDAVEIFIDGNNNKSATYGSDDRQIVRVSAGSSIWTSSTIANLLHAVATTASGYNVEIGIPWSSLGVSASTNKNVGLDIGNDDDDNGGARESQTVWNGDGNNWSSTAAFGTIRLIGTPPSTPTLEVSPSTLSFTSSAGSKNVLVTSNVSWTVSDNQSWISVNPASGSGNGTVSVSVTANSGAARSGTVTFTGGSMTQTVNVSQSAPSASGPMQIGVNFWNIGWMDRLNYFKSGVNWSTVTDPWNPTFLSDIAPFTNLRFMDFVPTNNSNITSWSQRVTKTANHYNSDGIAVEWMIDLCNRTNKDMWYCVPHQADANYITQLATIIHNTLDPSLKIYIEYSNETWNGGFSQFQYTIDQGIANNLPGSNQWYQGGAYSVWQSLKIFKAFRDVFGSEMSSRVVRVCSFSGNYDIFDQGYNNVVNSSTWNPYGEAADVLAIAPYVGSGLDGGSSSIQSQFRAAINSTLNDRVITAKSIANKYGKPLICYEGGQHLLNNAHLWSRNPAIYTEYRYMLDQWKNYFTFFSQYNLYSTFASGGAWGCKEFAGQSNSQAHKYRALIDWMADNGGGAQLMTYQSEGVAADENADKELRVFPNPASNRTTIVLENNYLGPVEMAILNAQGVPLKTKQASKSTETLEWNVSTSELKSGFYLIRIRADKQYVRTMIRE